jgi:hypothetical protein
MEIKEYKNSTGEAMILIIDAENDTAQSMLKSTYDAMQAEQFTPILTDEAKTK